MLKLPEFLNIHNVREVREEILAHLGKRMKEGKKEFVLDAAVLQDVDAAGIQLLLATFKACQREGLSFSLMNRGKMLEQLLELSGAVDIVEKGVFKGQ